MKPLLGSWLSHQNIQPTLPLAWELQHLHNHIQMNAQAIFSSGCLLFWDNSDQQSWVGTKLLSSRLSPHLAPVQMRQFSMTLKTLNESQIALLLQTFTPIVWIVINLLKLQNCANDDQPPHNVIMSLLTLVQCEHHHWHDNCTHDSFHHVVLHFFTMWVSWCVLHRRVDCSVQKEIFPIVPFCCSSRLLFSNQQAMIVFSCESFVLCSFHLGP